MNCPKCGGDTRVADSRHGIATVKRRRVCTECGEVIYTNEFVMNQEGEWYDNLKLDDYQQLARRTQNPNIDTESKVFHAITGMASEVGEIHSLFQHMVQEGTGVDRERLMKEIGDVMWFIGELCDCYDWDMSEVAVQNIRKLMKRYPNGFNVEQSINRTDR